MRALVALVVLTALSSAPAHAKDRALTFCLQDGEGTTTTRGVVFVWSEELDIARDAQNAFKVGADGCVEIGELSWNEVPFPLMAWMSVNYEVVAKGFYEVPGKVRIEAKKKRNTKYIMLEKIAGPTR